MEITEELLKNITSLKGEDITKILEKIQETDPGKEFLQNYASANFEKEIKPRIAKIYGDFEKDWEQITGETKPEGIKTYDWFKDKAKELKSLKESGGDDKDEKIKSLESTVEKLKQEGGQGEFWKKTHDEAVQKFEQEKQSLQGKLEEMQSEQKRNQVKSFLESGLAKLDFSVPDEAVDALKQVHSQKALNNAEIKDGQVVLKDGDGNPLLNKQYKPMSAEEYWQEQLSSVIKKPNQGGGGAPAGNKGDIITTGEGDDAKKTLQLDKGKVTSKRDFQETAQKTLIENGVERGSKEWNELLDSAYQDYGVKELPIQ